MQIGPYSFNVYMLNGAIFFPENQVIEILAVQKA